MNLLSLLAYVVIATLALAPLMCLDTPCERDRIIQPKRGWRPPPSRETGELDYGAPERICPPESKVKNACAEPALKAEAASSAKSMLRWNRIISIMEAMAEVHIAARGYQILPSFARHQFDADDDRGGSR